MKHTLPKGPTHRLTSPLTLSASAFYRLVAQGVICDGRAGGLIIGRSYLEGGIYVVRQKGTDFVVGDRTEGGEFVLTEKASNSYTDRTAAIDLGFGVGIAPDHDDIKDFGLVTSGLPDDKLLWLASGQLVIAADLARHVLDELFEMNERKNPFRSVDLESLFPE